MSAAPCKIVAALAVVSACSVIGCSDEPVSGAGSGGTGGGAGSGGTGGSESDAGPSTPLGVPIGPCEAVVEQHPNEGASHVPNCSEVTYAMNPPSSGTHYQNWAAFQTYDFPVPRGFLVHALEHGAVVLHYNCPDGCASEVEAAQAMIDELPDDPLCVAVGLRHRVILTPDPLLDVPWAASAWDFTLRAQCFSAEEFRTFYLERGQKGREALCNQGVDFGGMPPCP